MFTEAFIGRYNKSLQRDAKAPSSPFPAHVCNAEVTYPVCCQRAPPALAVTCLRSEKVSERLLATGREFGPHMLAFAYAKNNSKSACICHTEEQKLTNISMEIGN